MTGDKFFFLTNAITLLVITKGNCSSLGKVIFGIRGFMVGSILQCFRTVFAKCLLVYHEMYSTFIMPTLITAAPCKASVLSFLSNEGYLWHLTYKATIIIK